jgi:Bacterial PH domain/zinc-ribbon domain
MPSYIEETLTKGENVLYSAKVSIFMLVPYFVIGLILMFFYVPLGLFVWLWALVQFLLVFFTTELAVTNKRVIAKFSRGLLRLSRHTIELNLPKVESVSFNQGIFGRMLNYGDIVVAGTGGTPAPIPFISDPIAFRKAYSDIHDQAESGRNTALAQGVADSLNRSGEHQGTRPEQGLGTDTVFCSECGVRNAATATFCSKCGNKIASVT